MVRFENEILVDDVWVEDVEGEVNICVGIVNKKGEEVVREVSRVKE